MSYSQKSQKKPDSEDNDWTSSSGDSSVNSLTDKEETHQLLNFVQKSVAEIYWDVDAFAKSSDTERQEGRRNIMRSLVSISDLVAKYPWKESEQKSVARRRIFKSKGT